ncbi:serine hydrolase domain-containing protein [Microlunatus aurantiacus]|uniref:Serine hydrolase domain-containing protein n=1 Tax=Microlunatus aurantiacus TaxID=446786 RepID=A0ABP7EP62_9ACTN
MPGSRLLVVGLAAAMVLGAPTTAMADSGSGGATEGRFDRPQPGFASPRTELRTSTPSRVGLDPAPLEAAWRAIEGYTEPQATGRPLYPGAVLSYGHHGRVVLTRATGYSRLYADGSGSALPEADRIRTRTDAIYDLASVSKLFTSIVVMQQVEAGRVDLDAPVTRYLPEFREHGATSPYDKSGVTVRQLLTHTSGLPAFLPLWRDHPDPASRLRAAVTADLTAEAGTRYLYSDLNLITLGALVTAVTGKPLDRLVADGITRPLRMRDTGYNPTTRAPRERIAATEFQAVPDRGMVWGKVHDENAWSFGGVAGHAGVFSTARDLGVLAQTMLNGGAYDGHRILRSTSVQQMITNENTEFGTNAHGLGFELDQRWYMGGLSSLRTAGHTGYTGTSLVIDFASRSFVILLTNRVHPSRSWGSVNPGRVAAAQGLAEALAVRPRAGRTAWFSGTANARTATVTVPLPSSARAQRLSWQQLTDTEASDPLTLQVSADGGTTWTTLPYRLGGQVVDGPYAVSGVRRWERAVADVPAGSAAVRWTYVQDAALSGRGIYLDGITVRDGRRVVVDTERHPTLVRTDGWTPATR